MHFLCGGERMWGNFLIRKLPPHPFKELYRMGLADIRDSGFEAQTSRLLRGSLPTTEAIRCSERNR